MSSTDKESTSQVEACFSTLVMSIGSSALMNLGIIPDPAGKSEVNKEMARFNIDLLEVLKEKTKNNLSKEEKEMLEAILSDLQMRFVQTN
ncbi:MAG: DUF1844 domain-containing protein [Bdellovibrionales bacterium]|nr:DUF1844 domain-containing protein [Bdellovibrionales bacterium]